MESHAAVVELRSAVASNSDQARMERASRAVSATHRKLVVAVLEHESVAIASQELVHGAVRAANGVSAGHPVDAGSLIATEAVLPGGRL